MLQLTGSLFGSYSRPCDRASAGADYGKMTLEKVTGQEPCSHRCPCGPGCVPAKQPASFYQCEARARHQKNTHLPSNFEHLITDCMNALGIAWWVEEPRSARLGLALLPEPLPLCWCRLCPFCSLCDCPACPIWPRGLWPSSS